MMPVLVALAAAAGTYLLFTRNDESHVRSRVVTVARTARRHRSTTPFATWLARTGLTDVRPVEFVAVMVVLLVVGAALGFALFGGVFPAVVLGGFAASFPVAASAHRQAARRRAARGAWPRLIEEIRIQTNSLGRSIPNALFDVGRRAPDEMRPAFDAAQREWLLTTDFERTVHVLKAHLADATADATCETLLVAHSIGGSDLDRRLAALVDDRVVDMQDRKDAHAKLAGARFARRFVLLVPLGMALAGLSVGPGRDSYATPAAQVLVVTAIAVVVMCWVWAGHFMRLPGEQRVFPE